MSTRKKLVQPQGRLLTLIAAAVLPLAGCSMGTIQQTGSLTAGPMAGPVLTGQVHGGQQPVVGATIQLYAAGTTGYGTGATALIRSGSYSPGGASGCASNCTAYPESDSNGNFTITGDYSCPSASSQVYIVATGGNPGLQSGTNPQIAMMAGLGSCGNLSSTTAININEVTTVATVWALQQFMSATYGTPGAFGIGAPSTTYGGVATAQVAMANSFSIIPNMVNLAAGTAGPTTQVSALSVGAGYSSTLVPNISVEVDKIYTLADILATCVNSSGGAAGDSPADNCSTLFSDAQPSGQTNAPADTVQAALDIATNPGHNASTIYGLLPATPAFGGDISSSKIPTDWTIAIGYAPQVAGLDVINSPYGVAIDAYGNAWFDNSNSSALDGPLEISPSGALLTAPVTSFMAGGTCPPGGTCSAGTALRTFAKGKGMAIDLNGYVWVTNNADAEETATGAASVAVLPGSTASGVGDGATAANATGYYVPSSPYNAAVDPADNVYVSTNTSSGQPFAVFPLGSSTTSSMGAVYQGMGPTLSSFDLTPYGLAVDMNTSLTGGPLLWIGEGAGCATSTSAVGQYYTTGTNAFTATPNNIMSDVTASNCTSQTENDQFAAPTYSTLGVAIDAHDNLWMVNSKSGEAGATYLVQNTANGSVGSTSTSSATITGTPSALAVSQWVAVDGNNNGWVTGGSGETTGVYSVDLTSGSPVISAAAAYGSSGVYHDETVSTTEATKTQTTRQLAIDASGNVWLAENSSTSGNYIVMIVGAAGPVVTPLVQAVTSGKLGAKP